VDVGLKRKMARVPRKGKKKGEGQNEKMRAMVVDGRCVVN
jgi:hypothetical protein